jgi:hypothetical protein
MFKARHWRCINRNKQWCQTEMAQWNVHCIHLVVIEVHLWKTPNNRYREQSHHVQHLLAQWTEWNEYTQFGVPQVPFRNTVNVQDIVWKWLIAFNSLHDSLTKLNDFRCEIEFSSARIRQSDYVSAVESEIFSFYYRPNVSDEPLALVQNVWKFQVRILWELPALMTNFIFGKDYPLSYDLG